MTIDHSGFKRLKKDTFVWRTAPGDAGEYNITITADDGEGKKVKSYKINVLRRAEPLQITKFKTDKTTIKPGEVFTIICEATSSTNQTSEIQVQYRKPFSNKWKDVENIIDEDLGGDTTTITFQLTSDREVKLGKYSFRCKAKDSSSETGWAYLNNWVTLESSKEMKVVCMTNTDCDGSNDDNLKKIKIIKRDF